MSAALVVDDLSAGYGGVPVLRGVRLALSPGEPVALFGANSSGKIARFWRLRRQFPLRYGAEHVTSNGSSAALKLSGSSLRNVTERGFTLGTDILWN